MPFWNLPDNVNESMKNIRAETLISINIDVECMYDWMILDGIECLFLCPAGVLILNCWTFLTPY